VAVHGCGGVGLSAVMIAVALGARVVAVDLSPVALARARDLGAEVVVGAEDDPVVAVREATGGGAAVSLDAVGTTATALASVSCLRPRGRHVQVGLLLGQHAAPPVPMGPVVAQELSLHGSHGMPAADYPAMLALVAAGEVRPAELVGRVIGLDQAPAALVAMGGPADVAGMTVVRLGA
jgi:D-arabinose 1-dehydrogenase-like Zn-dependent alcohol dehydrogenase